MYSIDRKIDRYIDRERERSQYPHQNWLVFILPSLARPCLNANKLGKRRLRKYKGAVKGIWEKHGKTARLMNEYGLPGT